MFTKDDFNPNKTKASEFKEMAVDDVISRSFDDGRLEALAFQKDAHAYGRMYGMKFETMSKMIDGKKYMLVMRIE